jgi:hypothetical protein
MYGLDFVYKWAPEGDRANRTKLVAGGCTVASTALTYAAGGRERKSATLARADRAGSSKACTGSNRPGVLGSATAS